MTQPDRDPNPHEHLASIALEWERSLDENPIDQDRWYDSIGDLSPEERDELRRATEALGYLHRMRQHLRAMNDSEESSAKSGTYRNENDETSVGLQENTGREPYPQFVGRFEILRLLGQGGFSRVFLARDPDLERWVALKIPLPHALAHSGARKRFRREAKAAALLSHPAIVPIYETGSIGPINFIAYQYVSGIHLGQWHQKRNRPFSPRTAALIIAELAEATAHAHQRGVCHRDLKPANILLAVENNELFELSDDELARRVRIADFGLAHLTIEGDESLTVDGAVVGTPAYMAPEQARGDADVTPAYDIYALGMIFFELLTGKLPFKKGTHVATLRAIERDPTPSLRKWNHRLPRDIEAICLMCLCKDPQDRYASAHHLARDLRNWLEGLPIHARRPRPLERLKKWTRREPALASALLLGLISLTVGGLLATWQWQRASQHLAIAESQHARAERHLHRSQEAIDSMISRVASELKLSSEFADLRADLLRKAASLQASLLEEEADSHTTRLETAHALNRLAFLQIELGDFGEAEAGLRRAMELLETTPFGEDQQAAASLLSADLRIQLSVALRSQEDEPGALAALRSTDRSPPPADDSRGQVVAAQRLYGEGKSLNRMGERLQAIEKLKAADQVLQQVYNSGGTMCTRAPELLAILDCRIHDTLGLIQLSIGQAEQGEANIREALATLQPVADAHPERDKMMDDVAICHLNLGRALGHQGRHAEAALELQLGRDTFLGLHERVPDKVRYSQIILQASRSLAASYFASGDKEAGAAELHRLKTFMENLDDRHRSPAETLSSMASVHAEIARLHHEEEEWEEARDEIEKGIALMRAIPSTNLPRRIEQLGELHVQMAATQLQQEQFGAAEESACRAVELLQECRTLDRASVDVVQQLDHALQQLSEVYLAQSKQDLAAEVFAELAALRDE